MSIINTIKTELQSIWQIESNKRIIKDVLLLAVATLIFHFLYWYGNMNTWIFGPFTQSVYDFFRILAFKLSLIPSEAFIDKPFTIFDTSYCFYHLSEQGMKIYDLRMDVNVDCSGVKQLLQFLLIMVLCRGKWYKKGIYFIVGSIIILFFNAVRIFLLTWLFADSPENFSWVHDWVARPMMYVIIFSLWLIWISFFVNNTDGKAHVDSKNGVAKTDE